ncbi:MAG: (deoxy)nucleoside triphosphate pyrophosphohydrolase [Candidatus Bathyarchaeia archaeon]
MKVLSDLIRVTAAIIQREGRLLLAQRKRGLTQGLKWELPGGKIEVDETPEDCLSRELMEELSVRARVGDLFASSIYTYRDAAVEILAYQVELMEENFRLNSHEKIAWVPIYRLKEYDLAEADKPIIEEIIASNQT